MRTITALAAAVALIAGMSVAGAQTQPTAPKAGTSMSKSPSTMGKKVTGNGKFCIEQSPGGALSCQYASLTACQQAAKGGSKQCQPNPNSGTTGAR